MPAAAPALFHNDQALCNAFYYAKHSVPGRKTPSFGRG